MKKKNRKVVQGILQTGEMIPITDPAEQAELDRRCREAEKMLAKQEAELQKARARKSKRT